MGKEGGCRESEGPETAVEGPLGCQGALEMVGEGGGCIVEGRRAWRGEIVGQRREL